jgi:hypothetical protein
VDEQLQGGLVLFWSLRNPAYPEKILRTPQPVTALDFSKQNPMTLAVGLLNGKQLSLSLALSLSGHRGIGLHTRLPSALLAPLPPCRPAPLTLPLI